MERRACFHTRGGAVSAQQKSGRGQMGMRATISVEWGYEEHSITLTRRNLIHVRAGRPLRIRGKGYRYDGKFFWDYWEFNTRSNGSLVVTYCKPADPYSEGTGFDATLSDADIVEHP